MRLSSQMRLSLRLARWQPPSLATLGFYYFSHLQLQAIQQRLAGALHRSIKQHHSQGRANPISYHLPLLTISALLVGMQYQHTLSSTLYIFAMQYFFLKRQHSQQQSLSSTKRKKWPLQCKKKSGIIQNSSSLTLIVPLTTPYAAL